MRRFLLKTHTQMKPGNKKWWIDSKIVGDKLIEAESLKNALIVYQGILKEKHLINISNNALKNKDPMFRESNGEVEQTGYVITAKHDFYDDTKKNFVQQYIELWVSIVEVFKIDFEKEA